MNTPRVAVQSFSTVAMITLVVVLSWTATAQAYIDPGSGSMLVQLLLGGAAGVVIAIRVYWRRLITRFRSKPPERPGVNDVDPPQA